MFVCCVVRRNGETNLPARNNPASKLACVVAARSIEVQNVFAQLAMTWRASGINVVGAISEPHGLPDRACGAGILRDIGSGEPYSIYLQTAPIGTSCHIDIAGVERASAVVLDQVSSADIVVLSKFGKLEVTGRGLATVFQAAMAASKPILTSVADKHSTAWQSFAPDATSLTLDEEVIDAWVKHALRDRAPK